MEKDYDVFVSYRWIEPDQNWVRTELVPKLKSAGLRVLLDVDDFVPGRDLITEMERAGVQSHKVLCILSPDYFEGNRMVGFESSMARRSDPHGKDSRLIPFLLRPSKLPEWIRGLIPIDWTEPRHHAREWRKLIKVLGATRMAALPPASVASGNPAKHNGTPESQLEQAFTVGCYNYPPFETWKTPRAATFRPAAELTAAGSVHYDGPWFQIMRQLAGRLKLKVTFGAMTSVALTDLNTFNYDFIPGVFRTRNRERYFDFSDSLYRIGLQGVCKAGRRFTKEQLARGKFRIVVQPGEVGWEYVKAEFHRAYAIGKVLHVTSEQTRDVFNMLVSDEYDLAIGDEISCLHFLRERRWAGVFALAFPERLQIFDACIAVRKSLGFDLDLLNRTLRDLRSASAFLKMEAKALRGFEHIERCSVDWR